MNDYERRYASDYAPREVEAARRVITELAQVLGEFREAMVLVGGWVPELLLSNASSPHVGSIDVDLLLDPSKLRSGKYVGLLEMLERNGYRAGEKTFQYYKEVRVDERDPIRVDVEFLVPAGARLGSRSTIRKGFRALDADAGEFALDRSERLAMEGRMPDGRKNKIEIMITRIEAFIVMKSFAVSRRDKPRDSYDIYFCLLNYADGVSALAERLRPYLAVREVKNGLKLLADKFRDPDDYGPQSVANFLNPPDPEERTRIARDAYERVDTFLRELDSRS
jgi:hypothetical protein